MGIHDVVTKIGKQVMDHNRAPIAQSMRMRCSELKRSNVEINSSTSPRASLLGILAVHPQVVWVVTGSPQWYEPSLPVGDSSLC